MSRRDEIEAREQHALLDDLQALQALLSNGEATDNPVEPPLLSDIVADPAAPNGKATALDNGDTVDWARYVDDVFAAPTTANSSPQESRQDVAAAVLLQAMTVRLDARLANLRASMLQLIQAELAHVLRAPTQTREI